MKILRITALVFFSSFVASAQKEPAMPKDLPSYGPERPLEAPDVQSAKLDNGLTVWLVAEPGFPKIAVTLAIRGGFAADPADRPGISELLSTTVDQGTNSRNAKKIAEELQSSGGDLTVQAGEDSIILSTSVLSAKSDTAMAVLADVAQNATFPEAEVTLAKRNLADSLRQRESEPSFLGSRAMARVLFGDHPYHVTAPTQESVAASSPAELRKVFAERFRPDQALLVAVGDFKRDSMLQQVKTKFGSWKTPQTPALPSASHPSATAEHAIFLVPRP